MSKIKRFFGIEDEEKKPQQPKEWNPPSWQSYKERVEEEKRRQQPVQINDGLNENGNLSQEPIPAQDSFGEKEKFPLMIKFIFLKYQTFFICKETVEKSKLNELFFGVFICPEQYAINDAEVIKLLNWQPTPTFQL